MGGSTNIYVTAVKGDGFGEEVKGQRYRRIRHKWLLSVEPHKRSILGREHKAELMHFHADRKDEDAAFEIQKHGGKGIIGTVLIKEKAHVDVDHLREALSDDLNAANSSEVCEDSDRWLRKVLHLLQDHKYTDEFSVDDFMTFAHGYVADRLDDRDAAARVAYPGLHKEAEKKKSKHSFWISYPTASSRSSSQDPESRKYGGLM